MKQLTNYQEELDQCIVDKATDQAVDDLVSRYAEVLALADSEVRFTRNSMNPEPKAKAKAKAKPTSVSV